MFPVGAACGFFCGFVVAFLCAWFDAGPSQLEAGPPGAGEWVAVGVAFGGLGGAAGLVLAPVVYFIFFTQLSGREIVRAVGLVTAATISFGLFGGLLVNYLYALFTTVLGFFGSSLAVYSFYKDKSRGRVKDGVAV